MSDANTSPETRDQDGSTGPSSRRSERLAEGKRKKSLSMHDGVAVWCDCCSCEAEPYWAELAEEMGVDLGSDYEDGDTRSR